MLENYWEIMEIGKMKQAEIDSEIERLLVAGKLKKGRRNFKLHYIILEKIGQIFSKIGDSLQSQYHYESGNTYRKVS